MARQENTIKKSDPSGILMYKSVALIAALFLLLAGCDGSSGPAGPGGATGPAGPPGPTGPVYSTIADIVADGVPVTAEITSVSVSSPPVVAFTLTDKDGNGIIGLPAGSVSGAFAKLIPPANGSSSAWQSYVNREEGPDGSIAPGSEVLNAAIQADRDTQGTFVDNNDGTYVYTFSVDPANVTSPLAVPYEPSLTHRVALQIQAGNSATYPNNPTYTFRPADGATSGIFSRDIVSVDTCNGCHSKLAFHGGGRQDTKYCVTCHNPGSTDQDSGNSLDFKIMVHKIHAGAELANGYEIYGYRETFYDYSDIHWTQDIRNCQTCHVTRADAPDANGYLNVPSREACGSCHDSVNFASGEGHSEANLVATNDQCTNCHSATGFPGAIDKSHEILEQTAAAYFKYNVLGVAATAPGQFPQVTFSVTDPRDGSSYDINAANGPFTQGGGASRLAIDLAWSTRDYSNLGNGSATTPASAVSLNPLAGNAAANGDGSYTITSGVAIPATGISGSGAVAIEGHPAADLDGNGTIERLPVTTATEYFAITDPAPVPRREIASLEKCNVCHQKLSFHGANRNDNLQACALCHNANNTDIGRRPADPATTIDGKREESIDFKRMVHQIHAGNVVYYGFGGNPADFRGVAFPGRLAACDTCHVGNSYYPVDSTSVLATTIDSGVVVSDPLDDTKITPSSSACSSCHTSASAKSHMEDNGGAFDAMQTADGTLNSPTQGNGLLEACSVCHGPGAAYDVKAVHGITN